MIRELSTKNVVASMTSVLCALIRNDVTTDDLEDRCFWFNCHRSHVFNEIPYEATWTRKLATRRAYNHAQNFALGDHETQKLEEFRKLLLYCEAQGRVSWRCDRESHSKAIDTHQ